MPFDSIKIIIVLLTLVLLYRMVFKKIRDEKTLLFLISSIVITSILLSISIFKLHHILRAEFNIPNTVTYTLSAAPFIYHFYKFKNTIFETQYFILIISILLLGLAMMLDFFIDGKIITFSSSDFVEEILRIFGALFWLIYYIFYSFKINKI